MIFMLHYLLLNAGLPATSILIALYLQTYSQTSLSEIGTLLMALPFLSILVKPLLCALADRHQAHKHYLAGSVLVMGLGYGSLLVPAFMPAFHQQHGRLVWYLYVAGVVVGYSAFGVVWSLGDALSVNAANRRGVPWGVYRALGTFSWGLFGFVIGQINETPLLPKYTPAMLLLTGACALEILLLLLWPNSAFKFDAEPARPLAASGNSTNGTGNTLKLANGKNAEPAEEWAGSVARMDARLMNAVAGIVAEDIGNTLKSSLRLGAPRKRGALADLLDQHQLEQLQRQLSESGGEPTPVKPASNGSSPGKPSPTNKAQLEGTPAPSAGNTLTRTVILRTQRALSRMNSLSSATGLAIADSQPVTSGQLAEVVDLEQSVGGQLNGSAGHFRHHRPMVMSSLASNASLSRAAAARAMGFSCAERTSSLGSLAGSSPQPEEKKREKQAEFQAPISMENPDPRRSMGDLQLVLLKIIMRRDPNVYKFIVLFTLFGVLLFVHINFFFLHVELLCREQNYNFSKVMGALVVAQSISEIFTFLVIVPCYMPRVGRVGSMLTCCLVFLARYLYYATAYQHHSPYSAIASEACHGIAYGITYTLITDIALDCVNQLDAYLPELVARGLVDASMNPNQLKLPLRATMQGVFSGAFDGLGAGLGALFAGVYLDWYSFTSLWTACSVGCLLIAVIYPLTEWRTLLNRPQK